MELGLSQQELAARLNLTFQQIQKYEKGINRIGASRLFEMSAVLSTPISFFFEGIESSQMMPRDAEDQCQFPPTADLASYR